MVKGITMKPRAAEMPRKEDAMAMAGMEFDVSAENVKGTTFDGPASPEADRAPVPEVDRWEPRYGITQREWLERHMTVDRYRQAKEAGESDRAIMERIRISSAIFAVWKDRHRALLDAEVPGNGSVTAPTSPGAPCATSISGPSPDGAPELSQGRRLDAVSGELRAEIRRLVEEEVSRAVLDLRAELSELRALLKGHRHKVLMQYMSDEPIMSPVNELNNRRTGSGEK